MNQKFTIRPKPQEGESLSGYIIRISEVNCTKFWSVMAYLGIKSGYVYNLDTSPQKVVSISKLSNLLGIDEESILKMTFRNLFNKFYSNIITDDNQFRNAVSDEIISNKRRYCVSCLRESGYYKLLWQVKEIDMCSIHFTKLQSICSFCGTEQSFITSTLGTSLCFKCKNDISIQEESIIQDQDRINEQLKVIDDWLFLLSEKFAVDNSLCGYNRGEFLTIASLYVSQMMGEVFDRGKISYFTSYEITDFLAFIFNLDGGVCVSLNRLLKLSRSFEVDLNRLFSLDIPETYIDSLNVYRSKYENITLGVCLAPWCNSYKSNKSLITIDSRKVVKNYYLCCICKECFTKYGYNRNTGDWENGDGFIDLLWNKVLPSLNSLETLGNIESKYKINKYWIRNAIGYAANYKLLNEELLEKYEMKNIPNDIISCFNILYKLEGSMRQNAREYFKWNTHKFYYYLNMKEVQYYLIFEKNMFFRKYSDFDDRKGKLKKKFKEILEYYIEIDKDIALKNLEKDLGCSENTIYNYGLRNIMYDAIKKQKEIRKALKNENIINRIEEYFEKIDLLDDLLTITKVYKDLNLNKRNLFRDNSSLEYNKIVNLISGKVGEYNNKIINSRTQQLIEQANKIIKGFSMIGEKATYKKIALKLDIPEVSLKKNVILRTAIKKTIKNYYG